MTDVFEKSRQEALPGISDPKAGLVPIETVQKFYRNPFTNEMPVERTIQLWMEKGYFPRKDYKGLYPLIQVVGGVYWTQLALINKKKGPEGEQFDGLELREQSAKTEKAEIELQKMKEELVPADEVKRSAFEKARQIRNALELIPSRLSSILAAEMDPHKIKLTLDNEIKQVLEGLTG